MEKTEFEQPRNDREQFARNLQYARQLFHVGSCLVELRANAEGLTAVAPYDGRMYDKTKYREELGGWDHEHCFICQSRIEDGDSWWAAVPPDEIGLCGDCYSHLFGEAPGATPNSGRS